MSEQKERLYDCIIIGAGFSGLAAALYLCDNNVSNIAVLEARNRIGGRVFNKNIKLNNGKQTFIDAGGAYVGPTQNRLLRIAKRYHVKTYKVNMKGYTINTYNNKVSKYRGTVPDNMGIFSLMDVNFLFKKIDELSEKIDVNDVLKSDLNVKMYDNMTTKEWMNNNVKDNEAKLLFELVIRDVFCVEASEISFLYFLYYTKCAGGLMMLTETENGGQDSKFIGGSWNIANNMYKELNKLE